MFSKTFIVLLGVAAAVAAYEYHRVDPHEIDTLFLRPGVMATGRRSHYPQLVQIDGPDCGIIDVVATRIGWDGTQVLWNYKVNSAHQCELVDPVIEFEGYDRPGDKYVLGGSASLEFSTRLVTPPPPMQYVRPTPPPPVHPKPVQHAHPSPPPPVQPPKPVYTPPATTVHTTTTTTTTKSVVNDGEVLFVLVLLIIMIGLAACCCCTTTAGATALSTPAPVVLSHPSTPVVVQQQAAPAVVVQPTPAPVVVQQQAPVYVSQPTPAPVVVQQQAPVYVSQPQTPTVVVTQPAVVVHDHSSDWWPSWSMSRRTHHHHHHYSAPERAHTHTQTTVVHHAAPTSHTPATHTSTGTCGTRKSR